ncbi:amino acid adenylation domain-containing protein [Nitrosospira multiformis]|uniref:Amino acid adenylation domain-containing protein n=1 Tax=Nitrosospira multiformis TaxID=1231 RepID=A0A1H8H6N7_9PROT|nr:non-ribosomal peptide synthetase [Nitrosospira multiformis]SEN52002.1 amino acid adenylation domain-containing protein [Nitrosospira multiformis]
MTPRSISHRVYPQNLVTHLRSLASARPTDLALTAVHQEGERIVEKAFDYATLDQHVRALAALLQDRFSAGERALLLMENDEHYVIGFFACLYAGLIAVPVFPPEMVRERHLARLLAIAADAEARCILTTSEIMPLIARAAVEQFSYATVLTVDTVKRDNASVWREHFPEEGDIAFLQYTSGSTSTPKGVMVSHGNLMVHAQAYEQSLSISEDDVFVSWLPLYHDLGLIAGLLQPIHRGIPGILMTPKFFIERPVRWLETVSRHRATVSGAPNFAFQLCVERVRDAQLQGLDLSTWRVAFCGAEPVRYSAMSAFMKRFAPVGFSTGTIYPCYGLAEATLMMTGGTSGDGVEAHCFSTETLAQGRAEVAEEGIWLVACGAAVPGHTVRITNAETFAPLPDGYVGEIWIAGASLTQGYWRRARETAETFVTHEGERWLRTGDLGFFYDGQIYIAGRHKDLIIIRGQNVYPQDLEQVVEDEVEAARKGRVAAFSVETENGEGIGIAVEISRGMQKLIAVETLVQALSEAVSGSCHEPLSVVVLLNPGGLPKTSSGKLQRAACRQGWRERTLDAYALYEFGNFVLGGNSQPLSTLTDDVEISLAGIWETVLNRRGLGREDHFFASGGNSLSAVQAVARIAEHWQIDFTLRSLFENPKLRQCAQEIKRILSVGAPKRTASISLFPTSARINATQSAPLSFGQQRLWFLWQLDRTSTAYHIKQALQLSGPLDVEALQASLDGLVARHESLRTVFRPGGEGAVEQVLRPASRVDISHIDLNGDIASEREARAKEEADQIISAPFDLTQGPLLRVVLIRLAQDKHILVIAMHHIISDGASMQVLLDELAVGYLAHAQGQLPQFDPLPIRYADYAEWQRSWLEAGEKDRQLAYWRDYLGTEHPVLELPADHPRQPVANYQAARHSFALPPDVISSLRNLAQRPDSRSATLFMALMAGFQALLYRLTGQKDIRVGVPVANRNRIETKGIVGFFVNTQVLRGKVDGRLALSTLLAQVREAAIDAQAHQDLPFEQLVEALQPERSLSRTPLFQVTLNHLVSDRRKLDQIKGLKIVDYPLREQAAQFELTLETIESPDGNVHASFIYASELFDTRTIERLGRHYVAVLRTMAGQPEMPIGDVTLLSESDMAELGAWGAWGTNAVACVSGSVISHQSAHQVLHKAAHEAAHEPVHRRIQRQAEERPDVCALIFNDTVITYQELNSRSNQLAHHLIALGVKAEVKVGIMVERSIEMIVGLLGILKAGGAYVPLDPDYPRERLNYLIEDSGIGLLLTQSSLRNRIPDSEKLSVLELDGADVKGVAETNLEITLHPDNLAYVIYTSGSTGRPKGVGVSHGPLAMHLAAIREIYGVRPGDRELMFFSMNFDAAAEQWITPLCEGATLVLSSTRDLAGDGFVDRIGKHGITTLHLPPAYLRMLLPLMGGGVSSVRTCIAGGEAWFAADLAATQAVFPQARLVNAYGPTETVITPAAWVVHASETAEAGFIGEFAPIGRAVGDRKLYVLDEDLNVVPPGCAGELYIGGTGLARGYLDRPGLTADRFVADPFVPDGSRLYRTGDRVRWRNEDNGAQLEYLGRLDHQVKLRGFRVELGEIEGQLLAHPGVREAAVVAQESCNGMRLIAYVASHHGVTLNASMLKTALAAVLPDYMLPGSFVLLDRLPLNPNGKVDRQALPLPLAEQIDEAAYQAPVNAMETMISEIWAEVLGLPRVGLHNNFFDLGGHSLLLIKVQCKLEERLKTRIAIIDLFRYTNVARLAKFLGQEDRQADKEHLPLQRHQERAQRQRATFIQRKLRAGRTH